MQTRVTDYYNTMVHNTECNKSCEYNASLSPFPSSPNALNSQSSPCHFGPESLSVHPSTHRSGSPARLFPMDINDNGAPSHVQRSREHTNAATLISRGGPPRLFSLEIAIGRNCFPSDPIQPTWLKTRNQCQTLLCLMTMSTRGKEAMVSVCGCDATKATAGSVGLPSSRHSTDRDAARCARCASIPTLCVRSPQRVPVPACQWGGFSGN
jgi:hypothetical protein